MPERRGVVGQEQGLAEKGLGATLGGDKVGRKAQGREQEGTKAPTRKYVVLSEGLGK